MTDAQLIKTLRERLRTAPVVQVAAAAGVSERTIHKILARGTLNRPSTRAGLMKALAKAGAA